MRKIRNERQEALRDIIRSKPIKTQRAISEALTERGFKCTQATISRDITEMGLRKTAEGTYVMSEDLHLRRMVHDLVRDVRRSGNQVLVYAVSGSASAVAAAIDAAELNGVLGSIAGDDTILVIGTSEEGAAAFEEAMIRLIPEQEEN